MAESALLLEAAEVGSTGG